MTHKQRTWFRHLRLLAMTTVFALTACAVGPSYKKPGTVKPLAFKESAEWKQATPRDTEIRSNWWELFNDADLNKLEEQVAVSNESVKAQEAAWRNARTLVAEARSQYFPTIAGASSISRIGIGLGAHSNGGTANVSGINNNYDASLTASWEPDLWGRVRRQVESSKATAQASAADLAAVRLGMQATLAVDYLSLRMADKQKRVLDDTLKTYTRTLEITQNLYNAGVDDQSALLQAQAQLEAAQAQDLNIGILRAQYEHAIAMLTGKAPADFSIAPVQTVPEVPAIPLAVPSQLLERRPDVATAEREAAAANAQIGVAEAAYFPNVTLSASGGYDSSKWSNWFSMPNRVWSIGPSLTATLFDAGLRSAETEAAIATYDQTVANYRQTVLAAFQSVEDNLASLRILSQEIAVQQKAVADAHKSTTIITNQYKAGTVSYLNVLTAQTTEFNDELNELTLETTQLTSAAYLIENLGGGWNAKELDKDVITTPKSTPLSLWPAVWPGSPEKDK